MRTIPISQAALKLLPKVRAALQATSEGHCSPNWEAMLDVISNSSWGTHLHGELMEAMEKANPDGYEFFCTFDEYRNETTTEIWVSEPPHTSKASCEGEDWDQASLLVLLKELEG